MTTTMKKTLLASLVVPFALGAQSASAVQITDWGYSVDSSFTDSTESGGNGSVQSMDDGNTLSWGTNGNTSSVGIEDVAADSGLITNGDSVNGGTFTHDNQVISDGDSALTSFNLNSMLTLTPASPEGPSRDPLQLSFLSFFSETLNDGSCVDASVSNCDDIFTLGNVSDLGGTETETGFQFEEQSFTLDDFSYTVFLSLEGLAPLGSDACAEAGAPEGCVGLLTQEGELNSFNTQFSIVSEQVEVPEPGTLALLGMGLAGLGLTRRKARKS